MNRRQLLKLLGLTAGAAALIQLPEVQKRYWQGWNQPVLQNGNSLTRFTTYLYMDDGRVITVPQGEHWIADRSGVIQKAVIHLPGIGPAADILRYEVPLISGDYVHPPKELTIDVT